MHQRRPGLALLEEAVALLEEGGAEPELPAALLDLGAALAASGRRAHAREVLRRAAGRAERLGAVRVVRRAERTLEGCGAPPRRTELTGPGALTAAELGVAALAAEGRSNAEISAELHLARRTVETHLTGAYRKLGIGRRTELAAALAKG